MRRQIFTALVGLLAITVLGGVWGCTPAAPLPGRELPQGWSLSSAGPIDPGSPFALDPAGVRVALVSEGLIVRNLKGGAEMRYAGESANALAFSPTGDLAAAFPDGEGTLLKVYDPEGGLLEELTVPEQVTDLVWIASNELAAMALGVETYSFGTTFIQYLYRWNPGELPERIKVLDTTLKPGTYQRWRERFAEIFRLSLSPMGDEILYPELHDPPAFAPALTFVVRHLESGGRQIVGKAENLQARAVLLPGGEEVLWGGGNRRVERSVIWTGKELAKYSSPGFSLAVSPGGRYLFVGGDLYEDLRVAAALPEEAEPRFSQDGRRLLLRVEGHLWLIEGLEDRTIPELDANDRQRLLELRAWRAQGLITPADYLMAKERLEQ